MVSGFTTFFLKKFETSGQVLCDKQCNMMHGDGKTEPRRRKTNIRLSVPHQVIERGLFVVHVFRIVLMGARTVHMDDYDECERSLCSPYALLLSLLSWSGEDLSLRRRR